MKGKHTIYFDQYGNKFAATTVAGLRKQIGGGGADAALLTMTRQG